MNEKAFRDAIYDWVSNLYGLPCIWARQGGPEPNGPYVVLNIIARTVRAYGDVRLHSLTFQEAIGDVPEYHPDGTYAEGDRVVCNNMFWECAEGGDVEGALSDVLGPPSEPVLDGHAVWLYDGDVFELLAKVSHTYNITVSLKFCVPEPLSSEGFEHEARSIALAEKARLSLASPTTIDYFSEHNIAIVDYSDVMDSSILWDAKWVDATMLDIQFATTGMLIDKFYHFSSVEIERED